MISHQLQRRSSNSYQSNHSSYQFSVALQPSCRSLALTCHRLYIHGSCIKVVRLVEEDQAIPTLNAFIAKAELATKEDIQKPSLSHCIRHLCIQTFIAVSKHSLDNLINALRKLISMDGLRNLSTLTLQIVCEWVEQKTFLSRSVQT
jgi:hypothetical protein